MRQVLIATNNRHKLEEISAILRDRFELRTLNDIGCTEELAEDQETLEGNSLQKASYVSGKYGLDCLADDSGLEVEALNGAPGVHSARYAGPQRSSEDNIDLLLKNLQTAANRRARFRTVITLIQSGRIHSFEGVLRGTIIAERRGHGGFGYDPVFLPEGHTLTLAELSPEQKNKISHRAVALGKLANFLNANS